MNSIPFEREVTFPEPAFVHEYFDKAFLEFRNVVNLIQWEKFDSKLSDVHFVPLTFMSTITESAICLEKMQNLQPSIPLYAVLRMLMEASFKFRYLIQTSENIQLHALQLQYASIDAEEKEGKQWAKTPYSDEKLAVMKLQELANRKHSIEDKFKLIGHKPSGVNTTQIIEFLHSGLENAATKFAALANWSEQSGVAHGRLDSLQRYTFRQYSPDNKSASIERNKTDQYLIYSAATEYLHHATVAAKKLFESTDWYNPSNCV